MNFEYVFLATAVITTSTARASGAIPTCKVPSYLKKRPHDLVSICLNRFEAAKNVDKVGIVQAGTRKFSVVRHTANAACCRVSFGDDKKCPIAHVLHGKSRITGAIFFSLMMMMMMMMLMMMMMMMNCLRGVVD